MKLSILVTALLPLAWASDAFFEAQEAEIEAREDAILDAPEDAFLESREADAFPVAVEEEFWEADDSLEERMLDEAFEGEITARAAGFVGKLKKIGGAAGKLRKTLNSFGNKEKPSGSTVLKLQRENSAINSAIQSATKAAKGSSHFNKAQSKAIGNYIKGKLAPAAIGTIQDFIRHKPGLKKAGVTGIVKSSLKKQKGLIQALGSATSKKLSQPQKGQAPGIIKKITNAYNKGIKAF